MSQGSNITRTNEVQIGGVPIAYTLAGEQVIVLNSYQNNRLENIELLLTEIRDFKYEFDDPGRAKIFKIVDSTGNVVSTTSNALDINIKSSAITLPVSLTSTTITGSVAVTQSTSPWVVSLTSTTITGTVAATQSGNWSVRNQDGSGNAITSTGSALDVNLKTSSITLPVSLSSTTITGTVAVTQSTSPWVVSLTSTTITSSIPGVGATNLGKAEDATHVSGDTGVFMLAVRNDGGLTSLTNANGDYSPIGVDARGSINTTSPDSFTTGTITAPDAVVGAPDGLGNTVTGASTAGSLVSINCPGGDSSWIIQISGTLGGATYYFEGSLDSTTGTDGTWININGRQTGIVNTVLSGNTTVAAIFRGNTSGLTWVRLRAIGGAALNASVRIEISSGTGAIFLNASIPSGSNTIGSVNAIQSGTWNTRLYDSTGVGLTTTSGALNVTFPTTSPLSASIVGYSLNVLEDMSLTLQDIRDLVATDLDPDSSSSVIVTNSVQTQFSPSLTVARSFVPGALAVAGDLPMGVTDSGFPVKMGGVASTLTPTAVTSGQRVQAWYSLFGQQVVAVLPGTPAGGDVDAANQASLGGPSGSSPAPIGGAMYVTRSTGVGGNWDRVRSVQLLNTFGGAAQTGILAAGLAAQFDDVQPTNVTEGNWGNLRMSTERVLYTALKQSGNDRAIIGPDVTENIQRIADAIEDIRDFMYNTIK